MPKPTQKSSLTNRGIGGLEQGSLRQDGVVAPVSTSVAKMNQREYRLSLLSRVSLQMAGFQEHDLKKAMRRTREALNARDVRFYSHEGVVTDRKELIDHRVRLEAADRIFRMVPGVYAEKDQGKGGGDITVEIVTLAPDGSRTAIRINSA